MLAETFDNLIEDINREIEVTKAMFESQEEKPWVAILSPKET